MAGTSFIELDRTALIHNLQFLQSYVGQEVRISSVIKANAYGHGIEQFIPIAEEAGMNHFSVFSADEAQRVCKVKSPSSEVMIMGWIPEEDLSWVIDHNIQFFVYEPEKVNKALNLAIELGKPALMHLEVETGMNRTGLSQKNLKWIAALLKEHPEHLVFKGLCTHFAGAESIANHVRIQKQIKKYTRVYKWFINQNLIPEIRHAACSAAAISYPRTRMDMVRIGILQYGFWPSKETFIQFIHRRMDKTNPFQRVLSWKSKVMTVKPVKEGEFVSYGTAFFAEEDKLIAVVPVGYSHGYSRSLSNQGRVLIKGQRALVIGVVNMNMLLADITHIENVQLGDEVTLIGEQGDKEITLASFADFNNQLNYELLARLPYETPRFVVN